MALPSGAASWDDRSRDLDQRVLGQFRGSLLSSDGGLLLILDLDATLVPSDISYELREEDTPNIDATCPLRTHFVEPLRCPSR